MSTRTISLLFGLVGCAAGFAARAEDWPPVAPEQLQMTSEPRAPKAAAIYLHRQVDRDDSLHWERVYVRIKILTDEGRGRANVAIPFDKNREMIREIEARTIRADGSIVKFDGTVYEKPVIDGRDLRIMTKAFTLSDVRVGSIVEFRYKHDLSPNTVADSHWILSADLFTQTAAFSLIPFRGFVLRTSVPAGLPAGTETPKLDHGIMRMTVNDIPAFAAEEYMPPADQLKMRVDFVYLQDSVIDKDAATFWKRHGKENYRKVADFVDERHAMEQAVAGTLSAGDTAEQKLRQLYAYAQRIRNLSAGRVRSAQEVERENAKDNRNVADVLKHGYGDPNQITWLFLGLARAAGFAADPALIANRVRSFFNPEMENLSQLDSGVVMVKLDGRERYMAPGVPLTPFGALPWGLTAAKGLRLDRDGGTWVTTPLPAAKESRLERTASLRLQPDGTLQGTATITFSGLEALTRRLELRFDDDVARKQALEREVKTEIAADSEVTLTNAPDWNDAGDTLTAVFDVTLPGWAVMTGQRAFIPTGLFIGANKHVFEHGVRTHAVYFRYPHERSDDIEIALPAGWQVDSVPAPQATDINVATYDAAAEKSATGLHVKRDFRINTLLLDRQFYPTLQAFFQTVRASDEEQAILTRSAAEVRP